MQNFSKKAESLEQCSVVVSTSGLFMILCVILVGWVQTQPGPSVVSLKKKIYPYYWVVPGYGLKSKLNKLLVFFHNQATIV